MRNAISRGMFLYSERILFDDWLRFLTLQINIPIHMRGLVLYLVIRYYRLGNIAAAPIWRNGFQYFKRLVVAISMK